MSTVPFHRGIAVIIEVATTGDVTIFAPERVRTLLASCQIAVVYSNDGHYKPYDVGQLGAGIYAIPRNVVAHPIMSDWPNPATKTLLAHFAMAGIAIDDVDHKPIEVSWKMADD